MKENAHRTVISLAGYDNANVIQGSQCFRRIFPAPPGQLRGRPSPKDGARIRPDHDHVRRRGTRISSAHAVRGSLRLRHHSLPASLRADSPARPHLANGNPVMASCARAPQTNPSARRTAAIIARRNTVFVNFGVPVPKSKVNCDLHLTEGCAAMHFDPMGRLRDDTKSRTGRCRVPFLRIEFHRDPRA